MTDKKCAKGINCPCMPDIDETCKDCFDGLSRPPFKPAPFGLLERVVMCIWVLRKAQPHFYVKVRYGRFGMLWRMAAMKVKIKRTKRDQEKQKRDNMPAGCYGCKSTLPCEETCGGDPFTDRT